jgi:hypothetical protein
MSVENEDAFYLSRLGLGATILVCQLLLGPQILRPGIGQPITGARSKR